VNQPVRLPPLSAGPKPDPDQAESAPARPGARPEAKTTKPEAKTTAKASRAEAKPEGKPEAKLDARPEAPPDARIDARSDTSAARVQARTIPGEAGAGPGAARSDARLSVFGQTLLGSALVAGAIGAALPAVLLSWLTFARLVESGTSALLQQTGGLEPTTFGGGYWMSLGVNTGIVVWSIVRRVRGRPAAWRPLVVLISFYVLALWLMVSLDACRLADVPDVLTTFALLGADLLVQYLLPVALLGLLLQGSVYLWRKGRAAVPAARRITAVAGCLGLAGVTAAGMLVVAGHAASLTAIGAPISDARAADLDVASTRQRYERVAGTAGAPAAQPCR
jgi:hypothetical protein